MKWLHYAKSGHPSLHQDISFLTKLSRQKETGADLRGPGRRPVLKRTDLLIVSHAAARIISLMNPEADLSYNVSMNAQATHERNGLKLMPYSIHLPP
jgi:hypothetical protein